MEPLISAAAPPWQEGHGGWLARGRRPLSLLLLVAGAGAFTGLAYRARDLPFLLVAYYLLALLGCCLAKLEQLRRDPAGAGAERRRVRSAVSLLSMALVNTFTYGVHYEMPAGLALKLAAVVLALAVFALWLYVMLGGEDTESLDGEHGHGEEQAPYEVATDPEQRV